MNENIEYSKSESESDSERYSDIDINIDSKICIAKKQKISLHSVEQSFLNQISKQMTILSASNIVPQSILLALSGGADSVALLHLLNKYCFENDITLYAAHVNHLIREGDADRDQNFCARICEDLEVQLFTREFDVPKLAQQLGKTIEEAARDVRYEYFGEIIKSLNISLLATAHNADDNAETVIFNLVRGGSLKGIAGIPAVRDLENLKVKVIRPIISCEKTEILDYCMVNSLKYCVDVTNLDTSYTRNDIRHNILPKLREIRSSAVSSIYKTSELIRTDIDFFDSFIENIMKSENITNSVRLDFFGAQHMAIKTRLIIRMFSNVSKETLENIHVSDIIKLSQNSTEGKRISLPDRKCARVLNSCLVFTDDKDKTKLRSEKVIYSKQLGFGENFIDETGAYIYISREDDETPVSEVQNVYNLSIIHTLLFDKIEGSLYCKSRDSFDKVCVGDFSKSLKNIFQEKKTPQHIRGNTPIICDDKGVLLVPFVCARKGVLAEGNVKNGSYDKTKKVKILVQL